jgi:WD40 repeat protein
LPCHAKEVEELRQSASKESNSASKSSNKTKRALNNSSISSPSQSNKKSEKPKFAFYMKNVQMFIEQVHTTWITKIEYIEDLTSIVTSSQDGTICFSTFSFDKFEPHKKTFDGHKKKSVNDFVWSKYNKVIISCGEERNMYTNY